MKRESGTPASDSLMSIFLGKYKHLRVTLASLTQQESHLNPESAASKPIPHSWTLVSSSGDPVGGCGVFRCHLVQLPTVLLKEEMTLPEHLCRSLSGSLPGQEEA